MISVRSEYLARIPNVFHPNVLLFPSVSQKDPKSQICTVVDVVLSPYFYYFYLIRSLSLVDEVMLLIWNEYTAPNVFLYSLMFVSRQRTYFQVILVELSDQFRNIAVYIKVRLCSSFRSFFLVGKGRGRGEGGQQQTKTKNITKKLIKSAQRRWRYNPLH